MLEGTDAKIHYVYYTPEMEMLRADGGLRTNSFLRLRKLVAKGKPILSVQDFGDAEKVIKNRALLGETARGLLRRGIMPTEEGWGGWLGRYKAALESAAHDNLRNRKAQPAESRGRDRDRSLGR
jgi:hypothetical protein